MTRVGGRGALVLLLLLLTLACNRTRQGSCQHLLVGNGLTMILLSCVARKRLSRVRAFCSHYPASHPGRKCHFDSDAGAHTSIPGIIPGAMPGNCPRHACTHIHTRHYTRRHARKLPATRVIRQILCGGSPRRLLSNSSLSYSSSSSASPPEKLPSLPARRAGMRRSAGQIRDSSC